MVDYATNERTKIDKGKARMQTYQVNMQALAEKIERHSAFVEDVYHEMNKGVVGQQYMIERLMIVCWPMGTFY